MTEPCPVCGSVEIEVKGPYRGTSSIFSGLKRVHCQTCGMAYTTPMPEEADLNAYNASYFASAHGGQPQDANAKAFFSGMARLRLAHIDRYLSEQDAVASTVLEMGPGPGFFANAWFEKHPGTIYKACETDISCHDSLKAMGVRIIESSRAVQEDQHFDLVVMSHVLEHARNPVGFLSESTKNLRTGGVLFIEVPCRDWEHKSIDEPHLLFFDKGPLNHLLNKLGFNSIRLSYHGPEIEQLRLPSRLISKISSLRSRLIARGIIAPFARKRSGMEAITDPGERAAIAPFKAHRETQKAAWWLRAVARKGNTA